MIKLQWAEDKKKKKIQFLFYFSLWQYHLSFHGWHTAACTQHSWGHDLCYQREKEASLLEYYYRSVALYHAWVTLVRLYFQPKIMQHCLGLPLFCPESQLPVKKTSPEAACWMISSTFIALLLALSWSLKSLNQFLFACNLQRVFLNFVFCLLYCKQSRFSFIVLPLLINIR